MSFVLFLFLFRRNWKRRWFVLKDNVLTYHENDLEGAKSLGTIDIRNAVYVDMLTGFIREGSASTRPHTYTTH